MENDPSIPNDEWHRLISEMYGEVYSVVEGAGMRHFESEQTITAIGSTSYALPTDHLATIEVARVLDASGHRGRLRRLSVQERSRWIGQTGDALCYELNGSSLTLYPKPSTGTYSHLYMPQAPDLSTAADNTVVDLVCPDGEGFLIWGVVVKAKAKSESDVQLAMAEREAHRERFTEWCALRAFNDSPRPYVDRSGYDGGFDFYDPSSYRVNRP